MKRATVDKDRLVGDPAFVDIPIDRLTSKEYAAELAEDIRHGVKAEVSRLQPADVVPKDTTHVSVVDADGNCVSMTHSLAVASRKVIWLFLEQLRLEFVPILHRLQGRSAGQC